MAITNKETLTREGVARTLYGFIKKRNGKRFHKKSAEIIVGDQTLKGNSITYVEVNVDTQKFLKVYNINILLDLSKTAQKAFKYVASKIEEGKIEVFLNVEECRKFCDYKNVQGVYNAFNELLENKILYRSELNFKYFINPAIIFNGDRLPMIEEFINASEETILPVKQNNNDNLPKLKPLKQPTNEFN